MGSTEAVSIALGGLGRAILGTLAVCKGRDDVTRILGLTWLLIAIFGLSLLWKPEWTAWRDFGSYWIFSSGMLCIIVRSRYGNDSQTWRGNRRSASRRDDD